MMPDAKVLIFTAYSERALLQRGLESGRARLHPQGGAARDAAAGDREGRRRRDVRRPGADVGADEGARRQRRAHGRASARSCSSSPTACRTPTWPAQLFISQETVKSHVRHILTKLEADTRTQAVAIALRDAMID